MDAREFAEHPAGQRALIVTKVVDLAASGNEKLELPLVSLLVQLVRVASGTDPVQYEEVVRLTLEWGFRHQYRTGEIGKAQLRRALAEQAPQFAPGTFRIAADATLALFETVDFSSWDYPKLVGSRSLIDGLMANRSCGDEHASSLAVLRRKVDAAQRELQSVSPQPTP